MKIENLKFELDGEDLKYTFVADGIKFGSFVVIGHEPSPKLLAEYKNVIKQTTRDFCENLYRSQPDIWKKEKQISSGNR